MRIRIIAPTADYRPETLQAIAQDLAMLQRSGIKLEHVQLDEGPLSIRTAEDEALTTPGMIAKIVQSEQEGIDAVIVDCTSDVGVKQARSLVRIPVVGAGEASLGLAQQHGEYIRLDAEVLSKEPLQVVLPMLEEKPRAILIGGTGWSQVVAQLNQQLLQHGFEVPVIDPLPVALEEALRQLKK